MERLMDKTKYIYGNKCDSTEYLCENSLDTIECLCGNSFKKNKFKTHIKNCIEFCNKFKDFDLSISKFIKKNIKSYSEIIKFLFHRYIKLINHITKRFHSKNEDFRINMPNSPTPFKPIKYSYDNIIPNNQKGFISTDMNKPSCVIQQKKIKSNEINNIINYDNLNNNNNLNINNPVDDGRMTHNIKEGEINFIKDYFNYVYTENNGNFNNQIIEYISDFLKVVLSREWLIFIFKRENSFINCKTSNRIIYFTINDNEFIVINA